jgi:hypothetical protein
MFAVRDINSRKGQDSNFILSWIKCHWISPILINSRIIVLLSQKCYILNFFQKIISFKLK